MCTQGNLGCVLFPSAFARETVCPDVCRALGQDRLRTSVFTWTRKTPIFSTAVWSCLRCILLALEQANHHLNFEIDFSISLKSSLVSSLAEITSP